METSIAKAQRTYIKLVLGVLIGLILFIFLCWGGCRSYKNLESRHLVRRAVGYLGGGNLQDAALSARRSMQLKPNIEAIRMLAQVGERLNDRQALALRREALKLAPGSAEDIIALAGCALQFNETTEAERVLSALTNDQRQSAAYYAVTARLAESKKEIALVESSWKRAAELEPTNNTYALGLASVQLKSNNTAARDAGRALLSKLRSNPAVRAAATRALVADAVQSGQDAETIKKLGHELQSYPESVFSDRLIYLEILRAQNDPEFVADLTKMESDAATNPANLASLVSWMNRSGLSILALDFTRNLNAVSLQQWPVPLALADSYSNVADWAGLERLIQNSQWGKYEFLRHAYLMRAARATGKAVLAEREWGEAQRLASADSESIWILVQTVSDLGWKQETVELLWSLAKFPEKQKEALQTLYSYYANMKNTQGLYRVLVRLFEIDASDLNVQNNLAQIALLLKADRERARNLAQDLHSKDPANPAYASTYAYSLYEKGDARAAISVMEKLNQEQLQNPATAAYYGIFLSAAGDSQKAKEYLTLGAKADLLPEEQALLEKARR